MNQTDGVAASRSRVATVLDVALLVGGACLALLVAADGTRLAAWYVPPRNGRVVIVRHGASATRSDALAQAAVLAGNGYGVLVTDSRGHGASDGRAMDFGWHGDEDIVAALDFLGPQAERVAVLGLSMGGEEAIGAAAADDRLDAVVAEGATGRTDADKAWLSDEYGLRGWLQRGVDWLTFTLADALTSAGKPTALGDAVERSDASFLLIAAGDVADEQEAAERLQARAPERVEVWTVPGAGHTGGLTADPAEWEERVVGFLDRVLATPAT